MFVIIVGGGNTGSYLAKLLLEGGHSVKVIEERPAVLEKMRSEIPADVDHCRGRKLTSNPGICRCAQGKCTGSGDWFR